MDGNVSLSFGIFISSTFLRREKKRRGRRGGDRGGEGEWGIQVVNTLIATELIFPITKLVAKLNMKPGHAEAEHPQRRKNLCPFQFPTIMHAMRIVRFHLFQ